MQPSSYHRQPKSDRDLQACYWVLPFYRWAFSLGTHGPQTCMGYHRADGTVCLYLCSSPKRNGGGWRRIWREESGKGWKEDKTKGKENIIHIALSKRHHLIYPRQMQTSKKKTASHPCRQTDLHTSGLFVPTFPSTAVTRQKGSWLEWTAVFDICNSRNHEDKTSLMLSILTHCTGEKRV